MNQTTSSGTSNFINLKDYDHRHYKWSSHTRYDADEDGQGRRGLQPHDKVAEPRPWTPTLPMTADSWTSISSLLDPQLPASRRIPHKEGGVSISELFWGINFSWWVFPSFKFFSGIWNSSDFLSYIITILGNCIPLFPHIGILFRKNDDQCQMIKRRYLSVRVIGLERNVE